MSAPPRGKPAETARLAAAAALIAEDYLRFLAADWQDQEVVKAFAARQAAAKAALSHLELLRKLAGDLDGAREEAERQRALLLHAAREATRDDAQA